MTTSIGIALLGTGFMGRAHSNAWRSVHQFFDLPCTSVMRAVAGRNPESAAAFAKRWGWERASGDWRAACTADDVDLVDIGTPNDVHAEQALAALDAGKHVACEKPLAGTLEDARVMRDAAAAATGQTFVWFNYRRCPAVALAHQIVREGRLGRIFHVRAHYLQDWGGPATPALWRFDAGRAGSGAHGDLNAHIIDMARFITGDEIVEVSGAIEETFVRERAVIGPDGAATGERRPSTVDDCVLFLARLGGGAVASFEATRLATGNENRNAIEINGEHGSLRFDFERMNELAWFDERVDHHLRGWSRIMCTTPGDHPYADAYWPPAHLLGYEHGFVSQAADILRALGGATPVVPIPDFADAYETQRVLHAAQMAARERCAVRLDEVS